MAEEDVVDVAEGKLVELRPRGATSLEGVLKTEEKRVCSVVHSG